MLKGTLASPPDPMTPDLDLDPDPMAPDPTAAFAAALHPAGACLHDLPVETTKAVLTLLPLPDLAAACCTCRNLRALGSETIRDLNLSLFPHQVGTRTLYPGPLPRRKRGWGLC